MSEEQSRYAARGVSATKSEVHDAIKHLDKGLYPTAFCKVLPDLVGGSEEYCNIMHADTAGTKSSLAYLYWKETGDLSVWAGIAQDAMVMNLDDMACVGCLDDIVLSSTIGRNKNLIPGEVLKALIGGTSQFLDMLSDQGISVSLAGGETADVGDIVRTVDVGYTTFARIRRRDLVVNAIRPGDVIVGLSSSGMTTYENEYNGGMGSNGLTSARHDMLSKDYTDRFPDSFDPNTPSSYVYTGPYQLTDQIEADGNHLTVGKLLLSPTRTYLPVLKPIIDQLRSSIHGIIHCTGGAQSKVLNFVEDVCIVKDAPLQIPPLFQLIQEASKANWKEMYQVFNMGHRLELYVKEEAAEEIIDICAGFDLDAAVIGRVEAGQKSVICTTPDGPVTYT
ncbi:MAG: phosphoribosylformylglycinamidine cyclo-ligase [Saprospiraceae bacterium]|nr:phosphoribosylformylglycinamidine cyclo-ligase [Saprospiraceae bacterium]